MIKWTLQLADEQVIVFLDTSDPNAPALIQYEGTEENIEMVEDDLLGLPGLYGHSIEPLSSPVDVAAALNSEAMAFYLPEVTEGVEILESYESDLPDDVLT